MNLIADWNGADPRTAKSEIVRFNHRLAETGLFTDEALARLIDETPREDVTICTMQPRPPAEVRWIAGNARGLDGAALVEAARRGRLWVSPRSAMTKHPTYARVFDQLMGEFAKATGMRVLSADAAVLISSADMGIFFHVDPAETMLWHILGTKTILVYPPREDIVTEQALEAILLKETLSDLPWRPAMEHEAVSVELKGGEAISWPIHSPHRVLNGNDLNVSMSVDFSTPRSMLTNGVFYTNAILRRRLGINPKTRSTPAVLKPAYWAASR
ncbi:MAG: hypothetical protein WCI21_10010, partial [Alphaproteobacteria bacterium]